MKKIFLTLILSFILSVNVNATDSKFNKFIKWLEDNNHTQYLEVNKNYDECKNCTRWDAGPRCFEEVGKPKKQCVLDGDQSYGEDGYKWTDHKKYKTNLNVKFYKSSEIPWGTNPNKDTLMYYLFRYLDNDDAHDRAGSKGSKNHYEFKTELSDDKIQKYKKFKMIKQKANAPQNTKKTICDSIPSNNSYILKKVKIYKTKKTFLQLNFSVEDNIFTFFIQLIILIIKNR